jgi:colanic acid biosynthesis glycosyl transferase WcaI
VFVGSGAGEKELRLRAQRGGLRNVSFQPSVPRGQLSESLAVADLHAVTLLPGCEALVFPSKLYGVAAAGRPALFIGPAGCEVARVVKTEDLGISVSRDSLTAAARDIREIAANPARWERHASAAQEFSHRHSPASAIDAWDRLLTDLQTEVPALERTLPAASAAGSFP